MGLENAPDLPPFTSPFNNVIIFTISKLCRLKRGGSVWKMPRYFYIRRRAYGIDEVLQ